MNAIPEVGKPKIQYRNRTKNLAMSSNQESNQEMQSPQENPPSMNNSQVFGNITIGGTNNPFNLMNYTSGNIKIDQSHHTQTIGQNSNLEAALTELEKLKQEIAATNSLNSIQKKQAEFPVEMLETELKKPQPDKSLINEAVEALKKGLEGIETLAEPTMRVAKILVTIFLI